MFRAIAVILFSTLILLQVDVAPVAAQSQESQTEQKKGFFSRLKPKLSWKRPRFRNPFARKAKKSNMDDKTASDDQPDMKGPSGKRFAGQTEPNGEGSKNRKKNSRVEMARKKNSGVRHADLGDEELDRSPIRQTRFSDRDKLGSARNKRTSRKSLSHQEQVYQDIMKKSDSMSTLKLSEGIPYKESDGTKLSEVDPFTQPEKTRSQPQRRRSPRPKQNRPFDDSELDEFMDDSRPQRVKTTRRKTGQSSDRPSQRRSEPRRHARNDDDGDLELGREREEEFTSMPPRPRNRRRPTQRIEQRPRSIEEIERSLAAEEERVGTNPRRQLNQNSPTRQKPMRRRSLTDDDEFAELEDGFDDLRPERKQRQPQKSLRRRLSANADDLESDGSPFDRRSRFSKLKDEETSTPGLSDEWNNDESVPPQRSRRQEQTKRRTSKTSRFKPSGSDFDLMDDDTTTRRESTTNDRKTTSRFADTDTSSTSQRKTSRFSDDNSSTKRRRYNTSSDFNSSQFDSTGSNSGYTTGGYSSFGTGRSFGSSRTSSGSSSRSSRRR